MIVRKSVTLFFDEEDAAFRRMRYFMHEGNYENIEGYDVKGGENDGRFMLRATHLTYVKERN